jgi:chemotaxis protein CheX
MQAKFINPFLKSSVHVLEVLMNVRPSIGELKIKTLPIIENNIWLKIGLIGQVEGDIIFGFPEGVALKIVSGMMGGYLVTEFDEMSQSAISELGNMISGNASSLLSNEGIQIDITPPSIMNRSSSEPLQTNAKVFTVPLILEAIGEFNICVLV